METKVSDNDENHSCGACLARRTVLMGMVGAGASALAAPAFAQNDPTDTAPVVGDLIVRERGNTPLTADDIKVGAKPIHGYAMSADGATIRNGGTTRMLLLSRFEDADLTDDAKKVAADGVLVYTSICTHAGCDAVDWEADKKIIACPCHGSHFDPKNNGAVVTGPAARKLPQLPIKIGDGGKLVVNGAFDGRVGGDEVLG